MSKPPIAILGTGMAGFGAGHALHASKVRFICYDKNPYIGGHTCSTRYDGGFVFDEGGHISFTKSERVKGILADNVRGCYEEQKLKIDNYWQGYRIPHPVQCNLRGLPPELIVSAISDCAAAVSRRSAPGASVGTKRQTYAAWLNDVYGKTFADTFPKVYGEKYHTTSMDNLTTDWIGPRMYRPTLEEVVRGALPGTGSDVHYVDAFRYPSEGGFVSYLRPFAAQFDVRLNHELVGLDPVSRQLRFSNGGIHSYSEVISSIPLPDLMPLIDGAPQDVLEAARKLAFTTAVLVNIGLDREDISETAITYFYDGDIIFSRVNLPHMLSRKNAPPGCGSIQAEIYYSKKYKPLRLVPTQLVDEVINNLQRCNFIRADDTILVRGTSINRHANIIYDHDRTAALELVQGFLRDIRVHSCGRYGKWNHAWTDQAFLDGETTAHEALQNL